MIIQFIGCGKMGEIILKALLDSSFPSKDIFVITKSYDISTNFSQKYKINYGENLQADIIILAVKPQNITEIDIKKYSDNALLVSILAGTSIDKLKTHSNKSSIIRLMPNICMQVAQGIIGYIKYGKIETSKIEILNKLFSQVGDFIEMQIEDQIDKLTAISGSGPAYFYYLTTLLQQKAKEFGFDPYTAKLIANKTLIGSAHLLSDSGLNPQELISNIASKGGTTEKALQTFQENGFDKNFLQGVENAYIRAKDLNK